mgnify:CR=1 FL=1
MKKYTNKSYLFTTLTFKTGETYFLAYGQCVESDKEPVVVPKNIAVEDMTPAPKPLKKKASVKKKEPPADEKNNENETEGV